MCLCLYVFKFLSVVVQIAGAHDKCHLHGFEHTQKKTVRQTDGWTDPMTERYVNINKILINEILIDFNFLTAIMCSYDIQTDRPGGH